MLAMLLPAFPLHADGLLGRTLTFRIQTYDDPAAPLYESRSHTMRVASGPELGLEPEGRKEGFDLIPVIVDVAADRIVFDYANAEPGALWKAKFNGYVLDFGPGCPVLRGARLNPEETTLAIGNKRLSVENGVLRVNVSDMAYDRASRIVIDLSLSDCPAG